MEGKKKRVAVVTEGTAQAVLRRGATRELDAEEEKVVRMRLGAGLPMTETLERTGRGFTDTEIELLSYEIEAYLHGRQSPTGQSTLRPTTSRAKEKIIRALRRKS
jgi:DNA-directed RNA polymerase sigma subunit (sigma70/sigma32)